MILMLAKMPKSHKTVSVLLCEGRIFIFLTADLNKAICYFLLSVIPVFDKTNNSDEELVVGCNAFIIVDMLTPSDKAMFYTSVRNFFRLSCDYNVLKFLLGN
ncbi:hypothetical protein PR048_012835 [Dryococelus australis]|uniref:Uncharacterized protein n=1 Tax=Dryococelus australis TaxID=614101 RepID=A0ABQ9HQH7_9NEOP|nr:hypothetical protein PR048_012835 [Dryococelus australis]